MTTVQLRYESGVPVAVRLAVAAIFISCISLFWFSISCQWETATAIFLGAQVIIWFVALFLTSLLPSLGRCTLRMEGDTLILEKAVLGICWRRFGVLRSQLSVFCNTRTEIRGAFQSTRRTIQVYIPAIRTPQGLIHLPQIHRKEDADCIMSQLQELIGA